jgi:hypothetical protein
MFFVIMLFCMALSRIAGQMFLKGLSETEWQRGRLSMKLAPTVALRDHPMQERACSGTYS